MIKLKQEKNIYIITLNNKPVNALSVEFVSELSMLIGEISTKEDARGIIFRMPILSGRISCRAALSSGIQPIPFTSMSRKA